jgi:hypothetical protein
MAAVNPRRTHSTFDVIVEESLLKHFAPVQPSSFDMLRRRVIASAATKTDDKTAQALTTKSSIFMVAFLFRKKVHAVCLQRKRLRTMVAVEMTSASLSLVLVLLPTLKSIQKKSGVSNDFWVLSLFELMS